MSAKSILAIDDSRTMRSLVTATLHSGGYDVVTAEDGNDGVAKFDEKAFDAVITDINMPGLDGFGVIEAIRGGSFNRKVPILVLSTESSDEFKARARGLGATGWIVKPFDDAALLNVVGLVVGKA